MLNTNQIDDPQCSYLSHQRPRPILARSLSCLSSYTEKNACIYLKKSCFKTVSRFSADSDIISRKIQEKKMLRLDLILKKYKYPVKLYISTLAGKKGSLKQLAINLRGFNTISELSISIGGFSCMVPEEELTGLFRSTKKFVHLTKFTFNISQFLRTSDKSLEALSSGLRSINSITALKLDFRSHYTRFTDKGMKKLSNCLQNLDSLSDLQLRFISSNNSLTNKTVESIARSLTRLNLLASINLKFFFGKNIISNEDVGFLFSCLVHKILLSSLTIDISGQEFLISDVVFYGMSKNLKNIPTLQMLSVNFANRSIGSRITNKSLKNLMVGLKHLPHLSVLKLNFGENSEITWQGTSKVHQCFKESPCMKILLINNRDLINKTSLKFGQKPSHSYRSYRQFGDDAYKELGLPSRTKR